MKKIVLISALGILSFGLLSIIFTNCEKGKPVSQGSVPHTQNILKDGESQIQNDSVYKDLMSCFKTFTIAYLNSDLDTSDFIDLISQEQFSAYYSQIGLSDSLVEDLQLRIKNDVRYLATTYNIDISCVDCDSIYGTRSEVINKSAKVLQYFSENSGFVDIVYEHTCYCDTISGGGEPDKYEFDCNYLNLTACMLECAVSFWEVPALYVYCCYCCTCNYCTGLPPNFCWLAID